METKAIINFKEGTVELMGTEEFISQYLDKFRDSFASFPKEIKATPKTEIELEIKKVKIAQPAKKLKPVPLAKQIVTEIAPKIKKTKTLKTSRKKERIFKSLKKGKSKGEANKLFKIDAEDNIPSLQDFLISKDAMNKPVRFITATAYYITKLRGAGSFSPGNIEYAYSVLSINKEPKRLFSSFQNIKSNNGYIAIIGRGQWKLTIEGEAFVEMLPELIKKTNVEVSTSNLI